MCSYSNSTAKPEVGSSILGADEREHKEAEVVAVAQRLAARGLRLGTKGDMVVLFCP